MCAVSRRRVQMNCLGSAFLPVEVKMLQCPVPRDAGSRQCWRFTAERKSLPVSVCISLVLDHWFQTAPFQRKLSLSRKSKEKPCFLTCPSLHSNRTRECESPWPAGNSAYSHRMPFRGLHVQSIRVRPQSVMINGIFIDLKLLEAKNRALKKKCP